MYICNRCINEEVVMDNYKKIVIETPWSREYVELVYKFPAFYGIIMFITMFT